jgi:thiamine-phosphate pyrophosphorylase
MKLIVISNPINLNEEHSILNALFENGLEYYHLRKPEFTCKELEEYIQQIPQQYRNKVILHSHHQLAIQYGLKGVHFTYKNPYLSSDNFHLKIQRSASLHSLEEIKNANSLFQYLFISPIFDSISKPNYKSSIDRKALKLFLNERINTHKIIALGGINSDTIAEAAEMGFDGVALLGSIWLSDKPIESFKQLITIVNGFNRIEKTNYA